MGDSNAGKTSLVTRYVKGEFIDRPFPTIGESLYSKNLKIFGHDVLLKIYDTAGVEDYGGIQQFTIRESNAVIFAASYDSTDSLANVNEVWWNTITNVIAENTFIPFLAITKSDISASEKQITDTDIETVKRTHSLTSMCVSAKSGENVDVLFEEIAKQLLSKSTPVPLDKNRVSLENPSINPKKSGCC